MLIALKSVIFYLNNVVEFKSVLLFNNNSLFDK